MKKLVTLLILLLASSVCWGQTQNQGAIIGTVTDPTGAVIPGVRVTLRNVDTGVTRTVASTAAGDYRAEFPCRPENMRSLPSCRASSGAP